MSKKQKNWVRVCVLCFYFLVRVNANRLASHAILGFWIQAFLFSDSAVPCIKLAVRESVCVKLGGIGIHHSRFCSSSTTFSFQRGRKVRSSIDCSGQTEKIMEKVLDLYFKDSFFFWLYCLQYL